MSYDIIIMSDIVSFAQQDSDAIFFSYTETHVHQPLSHCKWCIPRLSTQTSQTRSLVSKCHTVSRCTRECNFSYAYKKCAAVHAPIFMKLVNDEQHDAQCLKPNFTQIG